MGLDATLSAHHSPLLPTLPISVGGAPLTEGQGIRRSLESGPSPAMQPGKLLGYAAPSDASELQPSIAVQTLDGLVCSGEGRKGWSPTDRPAKKWETGAPWNWGNVP